MSCIIVKSKNSLSVFDDYSHDQSHDKVGKRLAPEK